MTPIQVKKSKISTAEAIIIAILVGIFMLMAVPKAIETYKDRKADQAWRAMKNHPHEIDWNKIMNTPIPQNGN